MPFSTVRTFSEFNDFFEAVDSKERSDNPNVHVVTLQELGNSVKTHMLLFRQSFYQIALMESRHFNVSYFEHNFHVSDGYGLFLFKPCQLIQWTTDLSWKGFLIFIKENNLHVQNGATAQQFQFLLPTQHSFFELTKTEYEFFHTTFNQIYRESLEPLPYSLDIVSLYVQILLHKIKLRLSTSITLTGGWMENKSRKAEITLSFLALIDKDIERMKSVTEFASALHITPKYLTETVTHITGVSPKEHISNKIISITKTLLKHTNVNISRLAEQYNFKEQSHFANFFKERTGMSPLEYRFS